jgi:hypothetical protein
MIGMAAIVMNIVMLAIGLFLFFGSLAGVISERRSRRQGVFNKRGFRQTSFVGLGIALLFLLAISNLFVREIHLHSDLSRLRPRSVERIAVGGRLVTDEQRIEEIVEILSRPQWFNMSRGDAGDKVPLVIRFRDGSRYEYLVTTYQRGAGVALESVSPSGWENGQVLYPDLTGALLRAGITLPPCRTIQGKPVHCGPALSAISDNR